MKNIINKKKVYDFWNQNSCGESLYLKKPTKKNYDYQLKKRYIIEPYIKKFANFRNSYKKKVLEIGVGLGADHQMFYEAGADLYGVDLTARAIEHTKHRFKLNNYESKLFVQDAEALPFNNQTFDIVYSYGVLHHTPDTEKSISEVHRVLKNGGTARIMMYHKWSIVGFMLYLRYALFNLRPFLNLSIIYSSYLESPGTKAYSKKEINHLFKKFKSIEIKTVLSHGDLLQYSAGQRHSGFLIKFARMIWPRYIIKKFFSKYGLFLMIKVVK